MDRALKTAKRMIELYGRYIALERAINNEATAAGNFRSIKAKVGIQFWLNVRSLIEKEEGSGMVWLMKHPNATPDMLGLIPFFIDEDDPDPAAKQFAKRYIGGWSPMPPKFTMYADGSMKYAGDDDPLILIAEAQLRDETIRFYNGSWVAIIQKDGTFEVSRLD